MFECAIKKGYKVEGFDAYITTEVIGAAGVSSSASFEMLICAIMNYFSNEGKIDYVEYAKIGQYAEHEYWLKQSGLLDQMACAVGGVIAIDFKEEMPKVFESIRLLNMRGGNFTMPCKNIAAQLVDKLSPAAEIIGACNVFVNDDGVITGHITDGVGFVKNLEVNGVDVKDKKTVVLGAGGAATAIQVQLALDGASEVAIFNIDDEFYSRAESTKEKLAARCP